MDKEPPPIRVDLHNADTQGRVRLNTVAALADVHALADPLEEGMRVRVVDAELSAPAIATFNSEEQVWTAIVDWDEIADDPSSRP